MHRELSEQEIVRRESLQKLLELGINPYPSKLFDVNNFEYSPVPHPISNKFTGL